MDPDLLVVGRIGKAHGLRGEVMVDLLTTVESRLEVGSVLVGARGELEVRASKKVGGGRWIVAFVGVDGREGAEQLRGSELRAAPIEVEGALWVHELIGSEVVDTAGARLGTVEAVQENPASDLLVLEDGGLIPLRFVVAVDRGRITVEIPEGLLT